MKINKKIILGVLICFCMSITLVAFATEANATTTANTTNIKTDSNVIQYASGAVWQCQRCGKTVHTGGQNPPRAEACPENNWNSHIWNRQR